MKTIHHILTVFAIPLTLTLPVHSLAQSDTFVAQADSRPHDSTLPDKLLAPSYDSRLDELERRLSRAEHQAKNKSAVGMAAFLCAAFCALWAQQTGRSAWLWFFVGLIFTYITILVLLYKNSKDKKLRWEQEEE